MIWREISTMASSDSPSEASGFQDLDISIREQVQNAVARLAAIQDSDQSEEDLPGPSRLIPPGGHQQPKGVSLSNLEEQQRQYEEQVRRLEVEIRLLEDEVVRRDRPMDSATDEELERAILSLARTQGEPTSNGSTTPPTEEEDRAVRLLKSQIKLNGAFNGIKFKSVEWEIVRKDEHVLHRKHTHTGSVYGFDFSVQFIVQEEKSEGSNQLDPPNKARIVACRAEVDPRVKADFHMFLGRLTQDCDLMKFYQTYVKYCLLVHERKEAFLQAKSIYSRCVHLSEGAHGSRLDFNIQRGLSLYFTWNVTVTVRGYVDHCITLQVKAPPNVSDDERDSMSHLPPLLEKMTAVHGHKEALLRTLALFESE